MATIVSVSDFSSGEMKLPNATSGNAGEGSNLTLTSIMAKYEKLLLLSFLGKTQYDELIVALDDLPAADQKWQDLVDGLDNYYGLKQIVQPYIYCKYLINDEVTLTTTGTGKSSVKNHTVTDYNRKYVDRWNEFAVKANSYDEIETSLYEFMRDYDGLEVDDFTWYGLENQFGL